MTAALTWRGIAFGTLAADVYLGRAGVIGLAQPPRRTVASDRHGPGVVGGSSFSLGREVTCTDAWLDTTTDLALLWQVISSMDEIPSPQDEEPLQLTDLPLWPGRTVRVWARPEACDPDMDELAVVHGISSFDLRWLTTDPVVYSDELHVAEGGDTPATSQSWTVQNAGTKEAVSARALRFELEATTTVTSPFYQRGDHKVAFPGLVLSAGQKLHLNEQGHFHVGGLGVDGYARTGSSLFEDRPFLLAGGVDNVVLLGAASGTFTGTLVWRDQW